MLLLWGPPVGVLCLIVSRLLSWWALDWTARRLALLGVKGIGLGALAVAARSVISGGWLPRSTAEVILFVATELVWIPACAILVMSGLALGALQAPSRASPEQSRDVAVPSPVAVGIIIGATLISCLAAWQVGPSLSRSLEWGRYGFMPPVPLRSLTEVTRKTTVRFPETTGLVGGELLSGPRNYLIARVTMPASDLASFLAEQPFRWSEPYGETPGFTEQSVSRMAELGWRIASETHVTWALATAPRGTLGTLDVVVTRASPHDVNVYLYWVDMEEHWNC